MPVGTIDWPEMYPIAGVRLGATAAAIKYTDRLDTVVIEINEGASVAGIFTQNAFAAAPVVLGRAHLSRGDIRYLLINSGNANACTGDEGMTNAAASCKALAEVGGVQMEQVIPFSTGVIGEHLPIERLCTALPRAVEALSVDGWHDAARAIMTTDTVPKGASAQFEWDGEIISVTGIAKGAGMIRPNMATLLAFVATDAVVSPTVLDQIVRAAAERSFNRISVEGDTSTNDACMLIATGHAGLPMIMDAAGELYSKLLDAVTEVMQTLAKNLIRDGEGAQKFVEVAVGGGSSSAECLRVAYAIAHSPLVKTALFASDANWGRIVAAIGNTGIKGLDPTRVKVWLDDVLVVDGGARASSYTEALGAEVVAREAFAISVDLDRGAHRETIWTNDLSTVCLN